MQSKRIYQLNLFRSITGLFLAFAIIFSLFFSGFHITASHHHHETESVCSSEFEKDACHRFLVHHEESASCNKTHKHISEKQEECFTCKFFKERHSGSSAEDHSIVLFFHSASFHFPVQEVNEQSTYFNCVYLRGPPAMIA